MSSLTQPSGSGCLMVALDATADAEPVIASCRNDAVASSSPHVTSTFAPLLEAEPPSSRVPARASRSTASSIRAIRARISTP